MAEIYRVSVVRIREEKHKNESNSYKKRSEAVPEHVLNRTSEEMIYQHVCMQTEKASISQTRKWQR